ncbi:MAG: DNA-3-methyladenine glycosylase I [Gammaproteobacteria bacterium]|nr:DNA-3-methyladenine glycosylase I [Gammaproteobacteria bacterium]
MDKIRCFGSYPDKPELAHYHDTEWGVPVYDDNKLFELLILEGAHAGLSWETVLKKRQGYLDCFHQLIPEKVATMTEAELEAALQNPAIVRHRLKVYSTRKNAQVFLKMQTEFGSFSDYLWEHVNHTPIVNRYQKFEAMPATSPISDKISKDLKKRGMSFVGSTIIYAYIQGVGLVNDHLADCWMAN